MEESEHEDEPIGEETERELSLSREDDSDLSVVSDCPEEEYKCNLAQSNGNRMINLAPSARVNVENVDMAAARGNQAIGADEHAAEMSESESIESSDMGDNAEEESEYDEEAQWREEHVKL